MSFIADLHIHSNFSRATSPDMTPQGIWRWAQLKGIGVIGTGDFTHPGWFKEITEKLEPVGNGLLALKKPYVIQDIPTSCRADIFFMLTGEISCIYSKDGKTRKIHCILMVPDMASAARINIALSKMGNLKSDGRPILGLDAKELLKITLEASTDAMFIPAHAWTPHFSVFGAASGFDSLDECFEELTPYIYAIETGLSSNPPMNWRLSCLDTITLISNSDAHSPIKIGREANIFDTPLTYNDMIDAIKTKKGFLGTIEFFPEEGKYHFDGHRLCSICLSPEETINYGYICPKCKKKLTIGVMHRVLALSDRKNGYKPEGAADFKSIIPLNEIIAEVLNTNPSSKKVINEYLKMLTLLGNEFHILLDIPIEDIANTCGEMMALAIERVRLNNIHITPGFDGEYGKVKIFEDKNTHNPNKLRGQLSLF
ncbi:MAG TPA: endonuclease Q family protein [Syntrophorhabdaceae bacterium]|nr:endonuclease Q family protein [Syntrophorhabdaceae bacterium]